LTWKSQQAAQAKRLQSYQQEAVRHAQHDPGEREKIKIEMTFNKRLRWLDNENRCALCWMPCDMCVCKESSLEAEFLRTAHCPHDLILYMHHKEFSKTSNTGCILQMLGNKTRILVSGVDAHERELDQLLAQHRDRALVIHICSDPLPTLALGASATASRMLCGWLVAAEGAGVWSLSLSWGASLSLPVKPWMP
jgi:hypothetical protein